MDNTPKQQAVTREEVTALNMAYIRNETAYHPIHCFDLIERLLTERDEALKKYQFVSDCLDEERRWKEAWLSIAKDAVTSPINAEDSWEGIAKRWQQSEAEAKRIVEEGK